jgi:hypothetical protein
LREVLDGERNGTVEFNCRDCCGAYLGLGHR